MKQWIKTWWRRLFPVRQGLDAEQTRRFEEMLTELEGLDKRRITPHVREKIRVLQFERQRLRRALVYYAKRGTEEDREIAREALTPGDEPLFWRAVDGRLVLEGYVYTVAGDE